MSELSVSEGDTATLNIELSEAASEDVTLTLTVVGGSAVESVDYEPLLLPVVIRAGVLELTVSIRTIKDDLNEETETLVLELSVLSGPAVTGAVDRVTVSIVDDDEAPELPEVVVVTATLRVSELSVSEGDTATLNIELSEAASEDVTLTLTVVGGSAVESVDYELLLVPVVIRAGVFELTVSIRTIEDDLTEATETLVLELSVLSGPAVTGAVDRVTVTITDDDEAPELPEVVVVTATLRVSELSVSEGDTATLNIELSEAASEDVTLTLTVVGGSAVESVDYEPLLLPVVIRAGVLELTVSIRTIEDDLTEATETLVLELSVLSGPAVTGAVDRVTVTITDDDEAPELPEVLVVTATLRVSELSVSEGDTATLNIELSEAASEDVTLTLTVVGGSAVESVDYEPLLLPVVIRAGVLELTVSIRTIKDDLNEETETLVLELSVLSGPAVTGAVDRVTVSIVDDDEAPELPEVLVVTATLRVSELSVSEGDTATLNIELSEAASEDVTLTLTVVGGSAVESVDYEPLLVPVVIRAGVLELTVSIRTIEDDLTEATETLVLELSVLSGPAVTGAVDRVTVTITDDDEAPVVPEVVVVTATLRVSELSVSEGDTATLNIELSEAASEDVTLTLTVVGGSAVESVDYEPLLLPVVIRAGVLELTVSIRTIEDDLTEATETLVLELSVLSGPAVTGAVDRVTVTIIDDDETPVVPELPEVLVVTATLRVSELSVSEGDTATLNIELSEPASEDVTLTLTVVSGGSADVMVDYEPLLVPVVIRAGLSELTVSIRTIEDDLTEATETLVLELSVLSGPAVTGAVDRVTVTITDDDEAPELPEVVVVTATLRVSELSVSEGDTATLNIELSEAASEDVTLTLTVVGGSAVESVDYEPLLLPVVIRAGVLELTVSISTIEDELNEETETLVLELSVLSGPAVTGAVDRVTVSIVDDDEAPELPEVVVVTATLRVPELSVSEGDTATLNIELSEAASEDVTLTLTVVGGSAVESVDYEPLLLPVVIRAGVLELTVSIRTIDDELNEETETLVLELSVLSGPAVTGAVDRVTVSIVDDDEAPELPEVVVVTATLRVSELSVSEGDTATLNIELSEAASEDVTLTLTVVGGIAVESVDYELLLLPVVIRAGVLELTVSIRTIEDELNEETETLVLELSVLSGPAVTGAVDRVTVTITDDDEAPELPEVVVVTATLRVSELSVSEGDTATLNIELSEAASEDVTLTLTVVGGSAVESVDYEPLLVPVVIRAGVLELTVSIRTIEDELNEETETLVLELSVLSGPAVTGAVDRVTVTIVDDDEAPVVPEVVVVTATLRVSELSVSEGDTATLNIELPEAASEDVTLTLTVVGGSAVESVDYEPLLVPVVIRAGVLELTVSIRTIDDELTEETETFVLELSVVYGPAVTGAMDRVTVTITDDDPVPTVSLELSSESVTEGSVVTVSAELSGAYPAPVEVLFEIVGVSADLTDYSIPLSLRVTIPAGDTLASFELTATVDGLYEVMSETLELRLRVPSNAVQVTGGVQTLTIVDTDSEPTVSLDPVNPSVNEGDSVVVYAVLSGAQVDAVEVLLEITDVTASGSDYITPTTLLGTILPGETRVSFELTATVDRIYEGVSDETLTLSLRVPSGAIQVSGGVQTLRIIDSDPVPTVSLVLSSDSVLEGTGVTVSAELVGAFAEDVEVLLEVVDGTAEFADYMTPSTLRVPLSAGSTSVAYVLTAAVDGLYEGFVAETLSLRVSVFGLGGLITSSVQTLRILDVDEVTIGFQETTYRIDEDQDAVLRVAVLVGTLAPGVDLSLTYETRDDSAYASTDYTATMGTLLLSSASTVQDITVPVIDDVISELEERLTVELTAVISDPRVTVAPSVSEILIGDNDPVAGFQIVPIVPVTEGETFTVEVVLDSVSASTVTVTLGDALSGTSKAGDDYSLPGILTATIAVDELTATFRITTLSDELYEGDETLVLRASTDVVGGIVEVRATILDEDVAPRVVFERATSTVAEGSSVSVLVVLAGVLSESDIEVDFMVSGTAVEGTDYAPLGRSVTIPSGAGTGTIVLSTLDDSVYVGGVSETVVLVLTGASGGVMLGESVTHTVTIIDDELAPVVEPRVVVDVTATLSVTSVMLPEGETRTLEIVLTDVASEDVTFTLVPVSGTVDTDDYRLTPTVILIGAGDDSATVSLFAVDDSDREDERFVLELRTVSSGVVVGVSETVTVTIIDEDETPVVPELPEVVVVTATLRVSELSVSEGDTTTLNIELSEATSEDVTLTLTVVGGSAVESVDYEPLLVPVVIRAGVLELTVSIRTIEDELNEETETLVLELSVLSGPAVTGAMDRVTVTITDDEPVPTVSLELSSESVTEGSVVTVSAELSGAYPAPVEVLFEIVGVSADLTDYSIPLSLRVTIPAGDTLASFELTATVDGLYEVMSETLELRLRVPSNAVQVTGGVQTLTIVDTDSEPTVSLDPVNPSVNEGDSVVVDAVLSGAQVDAVEVLLEITDVTASGSDYITPTTLLGTILPGETRVSFELTATVDRIYEGVSDETLTLSLRVPSGAIQVSGGVQTLRIIDSDPVPTVSLVLSSDSVLEGTGVTVSAELVGAFAEDVEVLLEVVDGTAEFADYMTPSTLRVPLSAGSTSVAYVLTAAVDGLYEGFVAETLSLRVSVFGLGGLITSSVQTLRILDVDEVTIGFQETTYRIDEDQDAVLRVAVLVGTLAPGVDLSLTYETRDDSAYASTDYTATMGTLLLSSASTVQDITVPVIDDVISELEERLTVELTAVISDPRVTVAPSVSEILIGDNDPVAGFQIVPIVPVTEGETFTVEVVLDSVSASTVTVTLGDALSGTSKAGDDYSLPGILTATIAVDELTATFRITTLSDELYEGDETLVLRASTDVVGGIVEVRATILDEDVAPRVVFERATSTFAEGSSVSVLVVLAGVLSESDIEVDFMVSGTAVEGTDYAPLGRSVTILSGAGTGTIVLSTLDDSVYVGGGSETVVLVLTGASGGVMLGESVTHTVTIIDDELAPVVEPPVVVDVTATISPERVTLSEGASVSLEIVLESAASVDVTLTLVLENEVGGVTASDYSLTPTAVFISAGMTRAIVSLLAYDDPDREDEESFDLRLVSASSGVTVAVGSVVTVTIEASDQPMDITPGVDVVTATLRVSSETVSESDSETLYIELSEATTEDVTVTLTVTGTATGDVDYSLLPLAPYVLTAGETELAVGISTVVDGLYEREETIEFVISTLSGPAVTGAVDRVTVTIVEEVPTVSLALSSESVIEGGIFTGTVRLSGPVGFELRITELRYVPVGSTAEMADYVVLESLQTGELRIAAGMTTAVVTFQTRPDGIYEGTEILVLRPYALGGGLNLEGRSGEIAIRDADLRPTVSLESPGQVAEGGSITVIARLDGALESTVTVELSPTNGNAESDDYTISPASVTILPGATVAKFTLNARPDIIPTFETTETLTLNPVAIIVEGSVSLDTDSSSVPHEVMISESLPVPEVTLGVQGPSGFNEDQRGIQIEATVQPLTEFTVTVSLSRGAGSTAKDTDFELEASTLEIDPDIGFVFFTLDITDDEFYEDTETLNLEGYATGSGIELPVQALETTIIDNDSLPTLRLVPVGEVTEGHSTTIEVYLTDGLTTTVRVSLAYGVGSTASQNDYILSEVNAEIAAGKLTATFNLEAVQNELYELTETLILVPSASAVGLEEITGEPGVITIGDDEAPPTLSFEPLNDLDEGENGMITVRLNGAALETPLAVTVAVNTVASRINDISPVISPDEYQLIPVVSVIPAGELTATFRLETYHDGRFRGDRTLEIDLVTDNDQVVLAGGPMQVELMERDMVPVLSLDPIPDVLDTRGSFLIEVNLSNLLDNDLDLELTTGLVEGSYIAFLRLIDPVERGRVAVTGIPIGLQTGLITFRPQNVASDQTVTLALQLDDDAIKNADLNELEALGLIELGVTSRTFRILDRDVKPVLSLDPVGTIAEGSTNEVTVRLDRPLISDLTVSLTIDSAATLALDRPAEEGDYELPSTSFVIPASALLTTFSLKSIDDDIYEGDEQFVLRLEHEPIDTDQFDLGQDTQIVTIRDGDPPELILDEVVSPVNEGDSFNLTGQLRGARVLPITLSLNTSSAASTVGSDEWSVTPQTITVPAGNQTYPFSFTVTVKEDSVYEGTERAVFEVTAVGASERVLNRESFGLVEINDTNETPEISRITIPEGVTEGETFTVVVELDDALGTYLDVSLVHDGASTAEPKDYEITPPIYRIEAGQTIATLEVEIFDDRLYELTETLVFSITASNTEARIEIPMLSRSIEIAESEASPPRIVLLAIDDPITEGGDGVTVTVRVNGAFEVPLTLSLTTAVTSVAGTDDYSLSPETIVIPAGYKQEDVRMNSDNVRVEVEFRLTADTDDLYEGPEELILDLIVDTSADPRIDLNRGTFRRATTIMDVNQPGVDVVTATLRVSSETVAEGSFETLYIELSEATTEGVTVTLMVTGTATGDVDYSLLPLAPYVLTAGETELAVGISTVVDGLYEREETIEFVISTLSGPAVTGAVDRVTVTIVEEVPTVSLALSSESVIEGGIFTGTVRLSGPVGFELRITELRYVPVGSTAEMADYVVLESLQTGEIRIAAGMTTAVVTFQTRPDGIYEGTEILVLRPYALGGGLNLEGRSGKIAIRDADLRPTVSLESPGQVAEGGSITVIARLDGVLESTVTVELSPTNGNAESDDYTISPTKVTILPGATVAKFTLNARPDIIPTFETTETLTLNPVAIIVEGSVSLDTDSSSVPHEVMISESLPVPEVTLGVQGPSGFNEDQRGIQIEATVQQLTEFTVTVTLSRRADSTAGDTDFELEASTLEIDPAIGFVFFNLDIIDDVLYELTETLNLEGYATGGGIELPVQALETTIIDDDSLPNLRLGPVGEVTEGHSTTIEVSLTSILKVPVRVSLAYGVGSTASQNDYTLSEIDAEIAAGELTATFSLTADQNRFYEIDEQLILVPSGSGPGLEELTGEPGVVTIVDDETQPILELDRIDDIRESAVAFPNHYIPVRLIGDPLETDLSYDLAFGGSAIMGEDYLHRVGLTVDVIDAGQQFGGFVIRVGDDNSVGVDDPVSVVISVTVDEASLYLVEQGFVKLGVLTRSFYILDLGSKPLLSLGSVVDVEDSSASRPGTVREGSSGIFTVDLDSTFDYPLTATLTIRPTDSGGTTDPAELDDYRLFYLTDTVTIPTNSREIIFTIPTNSQRVMFTLEAIDNMVYEGDETLVLELSADGEAVDLGVIRRVVTIQDNDVVEVGFDSATYSVPENAGGVTITVNTFGRLAEGVNLGVEVEYVRGTASETEDYVAPLTLDVPLSAGATRATLFVEIVNDDLYENAETFSVRLVEPEGGLPFGVELVTGMTEATVTITNDDEIEIGFVKGMYTFSENQRQGTVQVRYSGSQIAPGVEVLVHYTTTVVMGDSFNLMDLSGNLVLSSNQGVQRIYDIDLGIMDDNEFNFINDEYEMSLSLLDMNDGLSLESGKEKAELNVITDDVLDFGFSVTDYEVNEASGTVELEVSVLRNRIAAGARVVVSYSTTPGSAISESRPDFEPVTGELILSSTSTVVTFAIPIVNDDVFEGSESFVVTLKKADGRDTLRLSPSEATVTINDNESLPTLSLDGPTEINEGDVFTITVRLSHEIQDGAVLIPGLEPLSTGTAGISDVSSLSGFSRIRAGNTTIDLTYRAIQDEVYEGTETLVLRPSGFVLGVFESLDAVSSEIIIIDDDHVEIGFDQSAYSVDEDSGTLTLTARLLRARLPLEWIYWWTM